MAAPFNSVQYSGQGAVGADQYNSYVQVVANVAALRSFTALDSMLVACLGTATPNDGGQGFYYFNASSTSTDNGTTVVVPTGAVQGAWLKWTGTSNV
jgi:hypothetical protein